MYSNSKKPMAQDFCENVRRLSSFEFNYWDESIFPNAHVTKK